MTKRQLGYLFLVVGLLVIAAAIGAHYIGGREAGFGPFQAIGVGAGVAIIVMAIPLIRLGNRPA